MYKTNCSCTGSEQTSVFVRPDSCGETFHQHHKHDANDKEASCTAHECHSCTDHTKSCGCDSPEIFFFKIKDKAVDDEVKFISVQPLEITIASSDLLAEIKLDNDGETGSKIYTDPPPNITSSLDFLIYIQQLKIPSLA